MTQSFPTRPSLQSFRRTPCSPYHACRGFSWPWQFSCRGDCPLRLMSNGSGHEYRDDCVARRLYCFPSIRVTAGVATAASVTRVTATGLPAPSWPRVGTLSTLGPNHCKGQRRGWKRWIWGCLAAKPDLTQTSNTLSGYGCWK